MPTKKFIYFMKIIYLICGNYVKIKKISIVFV